MRTGRNTGGVGAALAAACLLWLHSGPAGAQQPDAGPGPAVDEETATAFNQFRDEVARGMARMTGELARRYALSEEQAASSRKLVEDLTENFLKENGQQAFDVYQRMRSVQKFMRESQVGWNDLPDDIKGDLGERALPLLESLQKKATDFADALGDSLDDRQREMLAGDRKRMERALWLARTQVRLMTGRPPAEGEPTAPGEGTEGPSAPGAVGPGGLPRAGAAGFARGGARFDAWERYVRSFIERYRLDEVQKVKAMDLLAEYKAKAEKLQQRLAVSQPAATQPATAPAGGSAENLRTRLARLQEQRRPIADLFDQLKAELDKIPTPVQRELGGDQTGRPAARPAPSTQSAENR